MPQDETREKLVISDNKIRQLETQVYEEQLASASGTKVIMAVSANLILLSTYFFVHFGYIPFCN